MKTSSKKILSILLIPIVLFSTISFNVEKHICLDNVFSISIFGEADGCGMGSDICDENETSKDSFSEDGCCSDENQIVTGMVFNKIKKNSFSFQPVYFVAVFVNSMSYLFNSNLEKIIPFAYYAPPRVVKNVSLLYQVFII